MTATVGGNQNTNNEFVQSRILQLNADTASDVADVNTSRCYILIQNLDMTRDVWVRLTDATGVLKESIILMARGTGRNFIEWGNGPAMFQGQISAIADAGTPSISITEF